ncbi:MAG TPA: prolyl oligopeptidase family serine peptidase, partial [Saprospiraceae bacterium]|nr:prolyl oligopeptidase family serine peptidase [Saprospiraceae bacterium]
MPSQVEPTPLMPPTTMPISRPQATPAAMDRPGASGMAAYTAAIAVAPVTNWKWYDTIYTERFMRTEEENPDGYRENSPINFADQLKGNYLLVHGMGDDNVHFQNTVEMANALISANKQFDTYFYPNRNHGIYGDNTRLHLYTKMTNFLHEKLKNDYKPVGDVRP